MIPLWLITSILKFVRQLFIHLPCWVLFHFTFQNCYWSMRHVPFLPPSLPLIPFFHVFFFSISFCPSFLSSAHVYWAPVWTSDWDKYKGEIDHHTQRTYGLCCKETRVCRECQRRVHRIKVFQTGLEGWVACQEAKTTFFGERVGYSLWGNWKAKLKET